MVMPPRRADLSALRVPLPLNLASTALRATAFAPAILKQTSPRHILQSKEYVERLNSRVPLRRWGKPRDLAGVAVFLASEAASYVTGQQIVVDGGFTTTI